MKQIQSINPTTARPHRPIDCTPVADIAAKVAKAKKAQRDWAAVSFSEKCQMFQAIGEALREQADDIAALITQEMGKLPSQARAEVDASINQIPAQIAAMAQALQIENLTLQSGTGGIHYVPIGVAAIISAWNFPVGLPMSMLVPALLAGNTVLFKPSVLTTRTGLAVARIMTDLLPTKVVQTLVGGAEQGQALVESDIDFIGFVGSTDVGKTIMRSASERMCRLILELGGKDAMIVGPGADLEAAADFALGSSFRNSGQSCNSLERIYLQKNIKDGFLQKLIAKTDAIVVGSENADGLAIGPMASEAQMQHVLQQINDAIEQGATLVRGGRRLNRPGYYLEPTLLADVSEGMRILQDETFGPVACIRTVATVDEGIRLANHTRYGLTASLWLGDVDEARTKALSLEAGCVGVNAPPGGSHAMPWYGCKESGYGFTGGLAGTRQFLQPRSISVKGGCR